jgi:hypothetical protein
LKNSIAWQITRTASLDEHWLKESFCIDYKSLRKVDA